MTARWPVRWRLTLLYAALWLASVVLLGAGIYLGTRILLLDNFHEQLDRQVELALIAVDTEGGGISMDETAVVNLRGEEHFVRLASRDGAVIADTTGVVGGVPDDPEGVSAALAGEESTYSVETGEEGTFIVKTLPVVEGEAIIGVMEVGASREELDELLDLLLLGFGLVAPAVLLLAAGCGYLLAGRALAPVSAITSLASRIEATDLSTRLDLDLPEDELGRLARTFDAMLARIEDAFARQRRFTGDAAHELRTPLGFLRSQVDFALARPRSPDDYRDVLREIDKDLDRLTRLVSTLLTLARADSGAIPLQLEPVELATSIEVLLEQYEPLAREAGIALVGSASPIRITADEDRLIQLLVNLLDNALAHTPVGGRIELGCGWAGEWATLWVQDSGEGIPAEHLPMVCDPFYRVDTGRVRDRGGVGLGLSICKTIAEAHGGRLVISLPANGGTRVELLLPATAGTRN